MIKIQFVNEEDTVVVTTHGKERSMIRNGQFVGVTRDRIENMVLKNFHRIKPFYGRFKYFAFMNPYDHLNVVGELVRDGDDYMFKVMTVMFKMGFKPFFNTHGVRVNESENLFRFDSFMEAAEPLLEIASEEKEVYSYKRIEAEDDHTGSGGHTWIIDLREDGIDDEIIITIEHVKNPTSFEIDRWIEMFEDALECLDLIDGYDNQQMTRMRKGFDYKKWSNMLDIAEVNMVSKNFDYEKTGYGAKVALKLLRTRFNILKNWVNENQPDIFVSKPKKEAQEDTRRLRIYELYFKKYFTGYRVFTKDMTEERPWFSSDIITCISNRVSDKTIDSIENEVVEAIR